MEMVLNVQYLRFLMKKYTSITYINSMTNLYNDIVRIWKGKTCFCFYHFWQNIIGLSYDKDSKD